MFQERSLLERLGRARDTVRRTATEDTRALKASIMRHLAKMLNCRQGQAPAQMDYGIPDPTEVAHRGPDAIGEMQRAIRASIEKYEPRIKNVEVIAIEDEEDILTLRYQIRGELATSKDRVPVNFDTLLDSTGHIQVHD